MENKEEAIVDVMGPEQILLRPDVAANGSPRALRAAQSSFNQSLTSKSFTFNAVFDADANQSELMERSGIARIIEMALDGYSATVFCYGQTGSGKTHTLTGPPSLVSSSPSPKTTIISLESNNQSAASGNSLINDNQASFRAVLEQF